MTTLTHLIAAPSLPTPRRPRSGLGRRVVRAVVGLYADRPLLAASRPDDRAVLPSRPYADLPSLR